MGYERTTSRDIASDTGANVSLLYRYFGSKEGLFEVVLTAIPDDQFAQVDLDDLSTELHWIADVLAAGH
jgi:AcrR family transcriptional regulator